MKVFYDPRQTVPLNPSESPSAGKPAKALQSWIDKFPVEIMPIRPLTRQELYLAHDPQFVDDVLECRRDNGFENRLPTIAESLMWTNGSFYCAAEYAVKHKISTVSPTSGFHHAEYNRAMGFCTFNGLMISAILLKEQSLVNRVAIADIDMHYGNGADNIIRKLGIDFVSHYSFGRKALMGEELLPVLPEIIKKTIEGCDVLFYQAGADPHVDDPYGGALTTAELKERDRIVFTIAKEAGIPVVWNLAGGYQTDFAKVLEIHDNTAMMHVEIFGH